MGSYGNAIMAGFICRLCSEQKKCVIHLYSVKAKKLALLKKIKLIPIKVHFILIIVYLQAFMCVIPGR